MLAATPAFRKSRRVDRAIYILPSSNVAQRGCGVLACGSPRPIGNQVTRLGRALYTDQYHFQLLPRPVPPDNRDVVAETKICPRCGWSNIRPSPRRGLIDGFMALFFLAPFRCRNCRHRFYRFSTRVGNEVTLEPTVPAPRPVRPKPATKPSV